MSLSKTESPITKVIFLQKIFRFAGRSLKDLVIINFVWKDFEETMQAHHTFNLVLYDNIIKKRFEEDGFFYRCSTFLSSASAWIVYQWTIVNEHDAEQRKLLKSFLLYQAEFDNLIVIRDNVSDEDPSTTRELFRHVLDSSVELGIAKEMFEASTGHARNCIMHAVSRKISTNCLVVLLESCIQHGVDMKRLLGEKNSDDRNGIMLAIQYQLPFDSFKILIESCVQHGVDMKMLIEQKDRDGYNCVILSVINQLPFDPFKVLFESCIQHGVDVKEMLEQRSGGQSGNCILLAACFQCPADSFKLLIESCVQHGLDVKSMLEQNGRHDWNCIMISVENQLPLSSAQNQFRFDSFRLIIAHFPSNESFRATLTAENREKKRAVDYAKTEEIKTFLEDPDCWIKCREWCTSKGISTFRRAGQESGKRRERE